MTPALHREPSISPFDADRSRKSGSEQARSGSSPVSVAADPAPPSPRALAPVEAVSSAVTPSPAASVPIAEGSLALAAVAEPVAVAEPALSREQGVGIGEQAAESSLDSLRGAVCAALEAGGHHTAAALLSAGSWTLKGEAIEAEVAAKKTMLALAMNADAEKICRNALRAAGATQRLMVLPGEGADLKASGSPPTAPTGSADARARALEHPLVRQAQELFQAELRSVLDLRGKK